MVLEPGKHEVLNMVRQGLTRLGYQEGLIFDDYQFADITSSDYSIKSVSLAAFSDAPPSYMTAAFGVEFANGAQGSSLVDQYRALGAPQFLEILGQNVRRWRVNAVGPADLLEVIDARALPERFAGAADEWSPASIARARAVSRSNPSVQLDFFDGGLLPLLEHQAFRKLDVLLRQAVELATDQMGGTQTITHEQHSQLFRTIFRLVAAKVLGDRGVPGEWLSNDFNSVIGEVSRFYFPDSLPETLLSHPEALSAAWERIRVGFHFQNLSVDSLAYVYENTLVSTQTRSELGVHGTPSGIAEYILSQLPIEDLDVEQRRIFEPFAGHAVFLVAALRRLRDLLPPAIPLADRHRYFVERLSGIEVDDFAREVARLSLMLADYPNPDGWRLYPGDALTTQVFETELERADVVLCNPPFGSFTAQEVVDYGAGSLWAKRKPIEILHRVLANPPRQLGFVMPRAFIDGVGRYKEIRRKLAASYSSIELVALPDEVFTHSDAETVLLICHGEPKSTLHLKTATIARKELDSFYLTKSAEHTQEYAPVAPDTFSKRMWWPEFQSLWRELAHLPVLEDIAEIHRGIEYNLPFAENRESLISSGPIEGYVRGLDRVLGTLDPFYIGRTVFLNMDESLMRGSAFRHPWHRPKVIVNANRRRRGHWTITAYPDDQGLVCYQIFDGIWPTNGMRLEVLAAILNSPLANAYVAAHEDKRHVRVSTLAEIPIPHLNTSQQDSIVHLVQRLQSTIREYYRTSNSSQEISDQYAEIFRAIDAEVLDAYDLSPRRERQLLNVFDAELHEGRPGPISFPRYYPEGFMPFIPLKQLASEEYAQAEARSVGARVPILHDPVLAEFVKELE